jgi:alpha-1,3-mannosyltransferase
VCSNHRPSPFLPCMAPAVLESATARRICNASKGCHLAARLESFVHHYFSAIVGLLVFADLALAVIIIFRVSYTEIDWRAYMQEVSGILLDGELDYANLRGDTGPLVYPAGFVYIYSALYYATSRGVNVVRAQLIFAVLHGSVFAVIAYIYRMHYLDQRLQTISRVAAFPALVSLLLLLASRRVMSLFVLRLFNDAFQVFLVYASIACLVQCRWALACFLYSVSVSVKMNALLYAPALAVVLCQALGPIYALAHVLIICGGVQLVLGAPFLLFAPVSYISKAFEFDRVFVYKWSVNGAFLPEHVFLDKRVSFLLLFGHLVTLLGFGHARWTDSRGLLGLVGLMPASRVTFSPRTSLGTDAFEAKALVHSSWWSWAISYQAKELRAAHVVNTMFSCNLIGIAFARTLHYQFYLWYFHTLPLLAFSTSLPTTARLIVLGVIEIVFNVFPPRSISSLALCACHFILIAALWRIPQVQCSDIYNLTEKKSKNCGNKTE